MTSLQKLTTFGTGDHKVHLIPHTRAVGCESDPFYNGCLRMDALITGGTSIKENTQLKGILDHLVGRVTVRPEIPLVPTEKTPSGFQVEFHESCRQETERIFIKYPDRHQDFTVIIPQGKELEDWISKNAGTKRLKFLANEDDDDDDDDNMLEYDSRKVEFTNFKPGGSCIYYGPDGTCYPKETNTKTQKQSVQEGTEGA